MPEQVLKINMFGEFSMTYGCYTVDDQSNRSKKVWTLLEYLITFRNKEISQTDLIELLWPDEESDNPANALKTLLYRVRSVIDQLNCSDGKNNHYLPPRYICLEYEIPVLVDTEEIERLTSLAALR
jgi:two-component SAPR family response regulator